MEIQSPAIGSPLRSKIGAPERPVPPGHVEPGQVEGRLDAGRADQRVDPSVVGAHRIYERTK